MAKSSLRVVAPDPIADAHQVVELAAKTFGGYYDFRKHLRDWYLLNSHYDWKASAVGFMDGLLVTHYGVWGYNMRIGSAVVRCGGIGCVATDGDYRKRGLMAQTIPYSIEAMKATGYDMTILFGVWDFYHKFGYVRAWSDSSWFMQRDRLPKDLPNVRYGELKPEPSDLTTKLHNKYNAGVTGAAVRPTFSKKFCFFHGKTEGAMWKKGGKPAGYVFYQVRERLVCYEAVGEPDEILSVLNSIAKTKQVKEISFETLPYTSPLAKRLRQLTCKMDRQYIKSGGAMVRLTNLKQCLTKMEGELSKRVTESCLADYVGNIQLTSPEEKVSLELNRGKVKVSGKLGGKSTLVAGHELAQLVMGTDEPMEVCEAGKMRLGGDAKLVVPVLFPNQYPQLHQSDRY